MIVNRSSSAGGVARLAFAAAAAFAAISQALAQAPAQSPAAAPAITPPKGVTVPITTSGDGKARVEAVIDGKGPFVLIVDSGAELMTITPDAARRCGLIVRDGPIRVKGPTGGYVAVGQADVDTVQIAGLTVHRPPCSVQPLNFQCDGLIGAPLLNAGVVEIDMAAQTLTTYQADEFKPGDDSGMPILFGEHRIPVVMGAIGGIDARLEVDTGSSFPLEVLADFVKAHNLARQFSKIGSVDMNSISGPLTTDVYGVTRVSVGAAAVAAPGVRVPALFLPSAASLDPAGYDGRIGSPLLSGADLTFDYPRERLYFRPRTTPAVAARPEPPHSP